MAEPLFVLAPPCTFSWAVCAMLGQHPDLYALPELHLFTTETLAEWLAVCERQSFEMDHGLVRAVAELYYGGQDEPEVARARGWLRRRAHLTTGLLFELLAGRVAPRIAVEKSPSLVAHPDPMRRALRMFPGARFLHLVSHPRTYGDMVLEALAVSPGDQPLPPSDWLVRLAEHRPSEDADATVDPQFSWLSLHAGILAFLAEVPKEQQRTVAGEQLLTDLDAVGGELAAWLGVRADAAALAGMRHPEKSPYAPLGPPSAPFGSDAFLHPGPMIPESWSAPRTLDGPLSWRADGGGFNPEVTTLAHEFGYR
ncbi:sulfotransferase [Actinoplanes sp. L3-i22]|uniref:sulfotransferase n=1 Tax=Actinoplanes sp. L3-i22 TaxID=2836373 RepID=UPI001C76BFBD|nr:sulfotransferase [Actinoplanes sp. L3-i22]BCY09667.1 sulfotransferase family protein [Actinoplanes sp. L3-i22]